MNKIEEILQKYTSCEGTCICGCGLIEAMRDFGKICFEAGRETERIPKYTSGYNPKGTSDDTWVDKYETYEDFLKEIEDEEGN